MQSEQKGKGSHGCGEVTPAPDVLMSLLLPLRAFSDPRAAARRWTDPHADHPALLMLPTSMQKKPKQTKNNNKKPKKHQTPPENRATALSFTFNLIYCQPYFHSYSFQCMELPCIRAASISLGRTRHILGTVPSTGPSTAAGALGSCRCARPPRTFRNFPLRGPQRVAISASKP